MAGGDSGGGSSGLGQLIDDGHGGALRADLQRYYGLDLADLWRGTLSPRRVWTLAEYLPEGSALLAALAGGQEYRPWTLEAQLTAALVNAVRVADANNVRANGGKVRQNPKPIEPPAPAKQKKRLDLSSHPLAQPIPLPE